MHMSTHYSTSTSYVRNLTAFSRASNLWSGLCRNFPGWCRLSLSWIRMIYSIYWQFSDSLIFVLIFWKSSLNFFLFWIFYICERYTNFLLLSFFEARDRRSCSDPFFLGLLGGGISEFPQFFFKNTQFFPRCRELPDCPIRLKIGVRAPHNKHSLRIFFFAKIFIYKPSPPFWSWHPKMRPSKVWNFLGERPFCDPGIANASRACALHAGEKIFEIGHVLPQKFLKNRFFSKVKNWKFCPKCLKNGFDMIFWANYCVLEMLECFKMCISNV